MGGNNEAQPVVSSSIACVMWNDWGNLSRANFAVKWINFFAEVGIPVQWIKKKPKSESSFQFPLQWIVKKTLLISIPMREL